MFDIGFWELCLVGLVSLIVIGPERLPKAARIAGFWAGKARNLVQNVKTDVMEEFQAEELRQNLREHQTNLDEFKRLASNIANSGHSSKQSKEKIIQETREKLQDASRHDRK